MTTDIRLRARQTLTPQDYKEGRKEMFYLKRTKHILFTVIWRQTYGTEPLR